MPTIEKDIEVDAPLDAVYRAWTQYERFPEFMENVKEVRRAGPGLTHWVAQAAGQEVEWDAHTTEEDRQRIAWRASGESGQSGEVRFEPLGAARTRLHVRLDYSLPSRLKEAAASGLGIDERIMSNDLDNFRRMMEGGRFASGP